MVVGILTGCNGVGSSLNKEENYNEYYKEARIDREAGRNKEALLKINKAIKQNPTRIEGYIEKGTIYLKQNKVKEAIELYDKAIAIDDKSEKAHVLKAVAYMSINKYNAAIEECNKMIVKDNRAAEAYMIKSMFLRKAQYKEALEAIQGAIDSGRVRGDHYMQQGICFISKENMKNH